MSYTVPSSILASYKPAVLRSVFNTFCALFFKSLFRMHVARLSGRTLYVFDIDNTIGHTYPTLLRDYTSEKARMLSIPVFPRMKNLLCSLHHSKSRKVVFLTSRSYTLWSTTHDWLELNNIPGSLIDVILVSSPAEKVKLLTTSASKVRIVYIDDLSWNQERGELKWYDSELEAVKKLPITYIGYKTILRFNSKA
ncbi:MAG: hypothetical protein IPN22_08170 [Bacteroidetes bacterium]|nr:hypothetical protein [Bacteroidota bacterium]